MKCRFCAAVLDDVFLDLGSAPASNAFLAADALLEAEAWYPLQLRACADCRLVQTAPGARQPPVFDADYAYFSSYSRSWLEHARRHVEATLPRLGLGAGSRVVEVASNDGYLLQYVAGAGVPCLGIEPTRGTAEAARARGIETIAEFFGRDLGRRLRAERGPADWMIANNVLAHVPDINDFVGGFAELLAPAGVLTVEFPHLMQLVAHRQFDTVYHEHFSYFSLHTAIRIFAAHGLRVWDVDTLPTHGGSLRLWVSPAAAPWPTDGRVGAALAAETAAGMLGPDYYRGFQQTADAVKNAFLAFLLDARGRGQRVVGYGAAAKGNTLLNYAGVRPDLLAYVVDASPHKQGRFLPGSRIPVVDESRLRADRPDVVLILPWNLRDELSRQLDYVHDWGGRLAIAIPDVELW